MALVWRVTLRPVLLEVRGAFNFQLDISGSGVGATRGQPFYYVLFLVASAGENPRQLRFVKLTIDALRSVLLAVAVQAFAGLSRVSDTAACRRVCLLNCEVGVQLNVGERFAPQPHHRKLRRHFPSRRR